jgi:TP901 family phage tail tape measure protein
MEAEAAGLKTQSLSDRIKTQFMKYSAYFSVAEVIMYATQAIKDMFEQVKLIDSAMTELKKVTDETDATYNQFLKNAASRAKELGTTIDGLVNSTADFARLGYSFEESQGLAEVANIYAVVGDEIEGVEDATQSLVSTLAAFRHEIGDMSNDEFALSIVDKMNEVANNYAISSGGLGQALQRSASSMAAANNTLDETIALITAANEVAQNPEKVGNAFKTKILYCLCVQKCA